MMRGLQLTRKAKTRWVVGRHLQLELCRLGLLYPERRLV